ncbi:MAG: flagellar biosynthesis protein FlhF [Nitrospirae bacterium]|nr:flagellar biosynthesis protein FlhF [Nitrospirota bacterium]
MMIKSFEGADMNEALRKVKKELGSDAVILSSRKTEKSRSSGSSGVVVTAGLPQLDPPWAQDLPGSPEEAPEGVRLSEMDALRDVIARMEREWGPGSSREIQGLLARIGQLSGGLLSPPSPPFDPVEEARKILAGSGFPGEEQEDLVEAFRLLSYQPVDWSSSQVQSLLQFLVAQKLDVAGSLFSGERSAGPPQVILFVGPTGVGKTTTIAKIAALLVARHRRPVGLVNLDTYRIGAVEQLRIYGDLMGVPVEVVSSPSRLPGAIEHLRESEVILVDSAGRSEGGPDELGPFLSALGGGAAWDFKSVLVVSATQKSEDLNRTLHRFAKTRPEALVVTKVDETGSLGSLYPLLAHSRIPVAYVGTGQKVPEDIELAHGGRLAQWMIEGWSRDGSGIRT